MLHHTLHDKGWLVKWKSLVDGRLAANGYTISMSSPPFPNAHLLVSADELAALLASPAEKPLVLDLRPPDAYTAGHIPDAHHLDLWGVSLTDTDPAPLTAFMWMIEHVLAVHGVEASTPIVVYDEQSGVRAARAFWFLEYFGHPSVRLLDGGFGAWTRAGHPVSRDARPARTTEWTGGRELKTLATWQDVRGAIGDPDSVILDARTDGEYCGTTVRAKRGGVTPDRQVIAYCQGGYRAAHSYLALRLLGYPRVKNYVGSWKEWGDREDLPLEVPSRN
jgi:thiosulfate/3-mercaptopyruvate sulfurtransferase